MKARYLSPFFCIIFAVAPVRAQDEGRFSISGSVVNSVTGEPLKNALVILNRFANPEDIQTQIKERRLIAPKQRTTFTGAAGEFEFTGLAEARYGVQAQRPGFNMSIDPANRPANIDLTSSVSGLQLKLAPLGAIEGKVTDQFGEPVRAASIALIRVQVVDGYRTTSPSKTAATDDRGIFRFPNLQPGKYYVKAMGKSGGTFMYIGDGAVRPDTWESFAPVYSGGARQVDSATPITIAAGTQARADISLTLEPAFKIRGSLENFSPYEKVTFDLLQGDEPRGSNRVTLNGTTGRFEILDVLPGTYTLRATEGRKARGEALVNVSASDINNVSILLSPPVTVRGSVRLVGSAPENSSPDDRYRSGVPASGSGLYLERSCNLSLRGGNDPHQVGPGGHFSDTPDGQFQIPNVFGAEYRVLVGCFGGYPISIQSGSTDLLADSKITIQPGVAPPPIEITVNRGGGTLNGKLQLDSSPRNPGVLIVPAFPGTTGPRIAPVFDSNFVAASLPPGDYLLYAFSDHEQLEFHSPAFLQSLTGGVTVHIEDGKTSEVTITSLVK